MEFEYRKLEAIKGSGNKVKKKWMSDHFCNPNHTVLNILIKLDKLGYTGNGKGGKETESVKGGGKPVVGRRVMSDHPCNPQHGTLRVDQA